MDYKMENKLTKFKLIFAFILKNTEEDKQVFIKTSPDGWTKAQFRLFENPHIPTLILYGRLGQNLTVSPRVMGVIIKVCTELYSSITTPWLY